MSGPAFVRFLSPPSQDNYTIVTFHWGIMRPNDTTTVSRGILDGSRGQLTRELARALGSGGDYSSIGASTLLHEMCWEAGLELIAGDPPSYICFNVDERTFALLPEMLPLPPGTAVTDLPGNVRDVRWLDQLAPSLRTFFGGSGRESPPRDRTVAILFQEDDPTLDFRKWSEQLASSLRTHGLVVDQFPGRLLVGSPTRRNDVLEEIFFRHSAVVFLGHLQLHPRGHGWKLTACDALAMTDLEQILQTRLKASKLVPAHVVIAGCCSGAWRNEEQPESPGLAYPSVFLNGGIQYFIGAWMDVIGTDPASLCDLVTSMAEGFLRRWVVEPHLSVYHLYDTKVELGFPLGASLFHVYVSSLKRLLERSSAPSVSTPRGERIASMGALVSYVASGDQFGPYALGRELWSDSISKTFWATTQNGSHLVQVLSDSWQGNPVHADDIRTAMATLSAASLDDGHLIPARVELYDWRSGRDAFRHRLLALVTDRPERERPEDWSTLREQSLSAEELPRLSRIAAIGADLATRLQTLHEKKLRHGNLSPDSVAFLRDGDNAGRLILKDAWLSLVVRRPAAGGPYCPPDEMMAGEEPRSDCWSLAAIVYELVTGRLPFADVEPGGTRHVPSIVSGHGARRGLIAALDRIVRECLLPSAVLRPTAAQLVLRLRMAERSHEYLGEFQAELLNRMASGRRLLAILMDDPSELESTLEELDRRGNPVYVFRPQVGIVRWPDGRYLDWISREAMESLSPRDPLNSRLRRSADEVHAINGEELVVQALERLRVQPGSPLPILVLPGGLPWEHSPLTVHMRMHRLLRRCEDEYHSPAVLVSTDNAFSHNETRRAFCGILFPPLAPAELFERVLSAPVTDSLGVPELDFDAAAEISQLLAPISNRELTYALRLAALEYGCIDKRVVEAREIERGRRLSGHANLTYFPVARLPDPSFVGLPQHVRHVIDGWATGIRDGALDEALAAMPRRLLIEGPAGSGRTTLALVAGALTRRPVVRIEPSRALGSNIGDSERTLANILSRIARISGAIVLLDDWDGFLLGGVGALAPTVARMDSLVMRWLEEAGRASLVIVTARSRVNLPPQWQRRIELFVSFPAADGPSSDSYRAAVLQALFLRHGLPTAASDHALMLDIAAMTNPSASHPIAPHSPSALAARDSVLGAHTVRLQTVSDLEWWVQETLLLHGSRSEPDDPAFWRDKLR